MEPTREQFDAYRGMFDYFNQALFTGEPPAVVLNFSRHARTNGFFAPERWEHRSGEGRTHEISLNPDTLGERDPRAVASTLVHEMVHLWQHVHDPPPRKGYHDHAWASKMDSVGLVPSSTGAPGGRRVGQRMTHYVEEGGRFAQAFDVMPEALLLPWRSAPIGPGRGAEPKKRDPSKVKYACPGCCTNAWGKVGLNLICGDCGETFGGETYQTCSSHFAPESPTENRLGWRRHLGGRRRRRRYFRGGRDLGRSPRWASVGLVEPAVEPAGGGVVVESSGGSTAGNGAAPAPATGRASDERAGAGFRTLRSRDGMTPVSVMIFLRRSLGSSRRLMALQYSSSSSAFFCVAESLRPKHRASFSCVM